MLDRLVLHHVRGGAVDRAADVVGHESCGAPGGVPQEQHLVGSPVEVLDHPEGRAAGAVPAAHLDQVIQLVAEERLGGAVEVGDDHAPGGGEGIAGVGEFDERDVLVQVQPPCRAGGREEALRALVDLGDRHAEGGTDHLPGARVKLLGVGDHRIDRTGDQLAALREEPEQRRRTRKDVEVLGVDQLDECGDRREVVDVHQRHAELGDGGEGGVVGAQREEDAPLPQPTR